MKVTDEMVEAACKASWLAESGGKVRSANGFMRAAIEAALSHAAGQEATTNPAEIGRKSVGAGQGAVAMVYTMEPLVPGGHISYHASMRRAVPAGTLLYEHPAQPPASAEVGRDRLLRAIQDEKAAWTGDYRDAAYRALDDMLARVDAAMAASSGRKGGET